VTKQQLKNISNNKNGVVANTDAKTDDDAGTLPLSLFAITYLAEVNYQRFRALDINPKEQDLLKITMHNTGYDNKTPLDMLLGWRIGVPTILS
jgi:hypothetical protein